MSKKPSSFLNMVVTLVVVTGVSAFSLGFVFQLTEEPIAAARLAKQLRAIDAVTGDFDNEPVTDAYELISSTDKTLKIFPAKQDGNISTLAIQTYSENGYSGRVEIMVGIDPEGVIQNIEVLAHKETPGLGTKIADLKFKNQFVGKTLGSYDLRVTKDGGQVDAISGATISSRAFSEAVLEALETYNNQQP